MTLRLVGGWGDMKGHGSPVEHFSRSADDALALADRLCDALKMSLALPLRSGEPGHQHIAVPPVLEPVLYQPARSLVQEYVSSFQPGERSQRYLAQVVTLMRDLMEHAGTDDVHALTTPQIQAFIDHCRTHGRERRNERKLNLGGMKRASQKTRNTYVSMIRAFLQWCIDGERAGFRRSDANPGDPIRTPRAAKPKGRAWKLAEAMALNEIPIESWEDWQRWLFYRFLSISGMRLTAAAELPGGFLVLQDDRPRVEIPEQHSKTKKPYTAALDPLTAKLLRILRAATDDYAPSVPLLKQPRNDKLLLDCLHVGVAVRDERGRRAGFNCFRRFVPTQLDKLRINAAVAQAQLGHSDISTTLTYYTDAGLEDQSRAASALADALCRSAAGRVQEKSQNPVDRMTETSDTGIDVLPTSPTFRSLANERPASAGCTSTFQRAGRSFASDLDSPAPSGSGGVVMGAAGLEPVAPVDIPPRAFDLLSRVLSLVERHTPGRGAGKEPAHEQRQRP